MRTKAGLLLTAFAFLLASVATGLAQQNPAAGGNDAGRATQPAAGGQGAGGQGPAGQGGGRGQQPPPFAMTSTSMADGSFLAVKYTCTAGPAAFLPIFIG